MRLKTVYNNLFRAYGPQHWWPGDTPFEIMVGAVLTQNTAWANVEKAIANLKAARVLGAEAIVASDPKKLASWLKPSGYFNIKAKRLRNFCNWYLARGGRRKLASLDTAELRRGLLSVNGIGPETADDILLYAFGRPVFVVDAYTHRIFSRLGILSGNEGYEHTRAYFERVLGPEVRLFNEFHALIVRHGKDVCRPRPRCGDCCLAARCPSRCGQGQ